MRHIECVHNCRGPGVKLIKFCPICNEPFQDQRDFYPHARDCVAASPASQPSTLSKTSLVMEDIGFGGGVGGVDGVGGPEGAFELAVCIVCGEKMVGDVSVLWHLMEKHSFAPVVDEEPTCYWCRTAFEDDVELRQHMMNQHGGQSIKQRSNTRIQ